MTFRRQLVWTSVAFAAALTIGAPSMADAQAAGAGPGPAGQAAAGQGQGQGQGRGRGAPPYTAAPGAKDLKAVMFNWGWYTGMLRSSEEYDLLMTLAYSGKGTMQVAGQPCNVTMYRSDISYQTSGERIRITGTRPNGQSCSTIEVLSGAYAWNEDIMGAELVPGKGKATPMAATTEDRMIRLWANPQGAFKAAFFGTSPDAPPMTPRPQRLAADVATIGKTSVAWVGNKPVVTHPIPGVPTATAVTTLNAQFMPESVVVKSGANTYEFTYSDYKDWNNPLNPAEALYAGRMIEKKNGTVVRDITTTLTETGQMYVVVPVPASVKAAIKPTLTPANWTLPTAPANPQAAAAMTPRLPNGKPDLTGVWGGAFNPITGGGNRRCGPTQKDCKIAQDNFWVDYEWISPSRFGVYGRPIYKPEFWDKVQELDQWTNKYDPIMTCQPMGLPRSLTPRRIFQTNNDITMLYTTSDYGGGNREFRVIATDGRKHDPKKIEATYYGYSVGNWEGDTLVLDSINFVDSTWLGRGGLFHSENMHIVERLTRKGNELHYDITIEDPDSFVEPWVMPTRILRPAGGDAAIIAERAHCEAYEQGDVITNQLRH
jgi:hypothetical protein